MSAAIMGKKKDEKKTKKRVSLQVYEQTNELVNRVAGSRNESVAELMASREMTQFLHHLMKAATEQVTGSQPGAGGS